MRPRLPSGLRGLREPAEAHGVAPHLLAARTPPPRPCLALWRFRATARRGRPSPGAKTGHYGHLLRAFRCHRASRGSRCRAAGVPKAAPGANWVGRPVKTATWERLADVVATKEVASGSDVLFLRNAADDPVVLLTLDLRLGPLHVVMHHSHEAIAALDEWS
jgi:hypothetical protein